MMPIREFLARVTGAVGRRRRDRALGGLNHELQFHLEMMEQQLRREGMSALAAEMVGCGRANDRMRQATSG